MPKASEDVTFYSGLGQLAAGDLPSPSADRVSLDCRLAVSLNGARRHGRALVCPSFGGTHLSVTMRLEKKGDRAGLGRAHRWPGGKVTTPIRSPFTIWPNPAIQDAVTSASEIAKVLLESVSVGPELSGLIVVSGGTGSGKSTLAAALVQARILAWTSRLSQRRDPERFPHIVTFEDPIESWFALDPQAAQAAGFDYTPRQKGLDALTLGEVLNDALRQTPAVVYVGETRHDADWEELLRFAGSGHLVITTTHAGSVVETMAHILRGAKARSPAQRSEVVRRLVAIVHVKVDEGARVPALWWRTSQTLNAMTAEGLGSLLPYASESNAGGRGNLGRAYFVKKLGLDALLTRAVGWDLAGE